MQKGCLVTCMFDSFAEHDLYEFLTLSFCLFCLYGFWEYISIHWFSAEAKPNPGSSD
jgi:TRAP-type mannitol/chloroaromatic compound transport system permease small subunit